MNPRAVAAKWMAGADSLMNDVRFLGGHGTYHPTVRRCRLYNNTRTATRDLPRRWDSQYWSLWITDGGGGTFMDIWTPNTFAQAGMLISDTSTDGRIYEMSSEHHVRNEIQICATRPTGGSTRSRPRRSAARAASRCRSRSRDLSNHHLRQPLPLPRDQHPSSRSPTP